MRLICGVLNLDGANASDDLLRAMAAEMAVPRLRPGLSLWRDGPVGLAVLDFSSRGGPVRAIPETAASVMAADVRLDEPVALARLLDQDAAQAEDVLLLAALECFGPSALDRVLGDFAFAHWQKKAGRLVCGRDIFGVRPFAYAHQPGKLFAFASLPKALYGARIVAKKIDEEALARRMAMNWRDDDSLVPGINRLPPAHFLEVTREGFSITRYWQPDRAAIGTRQCSPDQAARELRRLVDQAVRCRLARAGETAAHLSGGLDSSAIAVLAGRQLREQGRMLHAYSFLDQQRNDIRLEDESEFVKAVLEQESDIAWTPVRAPIRLSMLNGPLDADKITSLGPEDPENAICAHAEAQGVSVVLSGWGGDEAATFSGKGTLAELFLRGRWRTLAREISALSRERGSARSGIIRGEVLAHLWRAALPQSLIDIVQRAAGRKPRFRALLRRSLSAAARRCLVDTPAAPSNAAPDGRENRWRLTTSPHIAERTEVWAQTGARHGMAFAFPLLDRRVIEFALSLPSELFVRDGYGRRPFRDAMADVLPARVRLGQRKNMAFPSRLVDIAESRDELLAKLEVFEKNESARRLIDFAYVRGQIESFPSPERVYAEMRAGKFPAEAGMMVAAMQALMGAAYLEQHGSK